MATFLQWRPAITTLHSTPILRRQPPLSSTFHSPLRQSRKFLAMAAATASEQQVELKKGIAEFYDESSGVWEDIWGEHMHHGFYEPDALVSGSESDHRAAQIRMVEESLRFAAVPDDLEKRPKKVVDVGCGIGGSSRYLAKKYEAKCQGITLSPVQAQRANSLAAAQGLADKAVFQVGDALNQPFPDGEFDLVWSMESGEHMPDKAKFVSELARVAAPGGTIIIVTWCHRDLGETEESLSKWEKDHLDKICRAFYLPEWCSTSDYVKLLQSLDLQDIRTADWSSNVAPFWPAVIRSALTWKGFTSLLRTDIRYGFTNTAYRLEDHKRSNGDAAHDRRVQQGSHQVLHYHLQKARKVIKMAERNR
ncbi:Probable tocopherol O-methyltransferase, chloroplastic [Linum perenne]